MLKFLLIDFGGSRVKAAVVDLDTGFFSHIKSCPCIPNCSKTPGHYEIPLLALKKQFLSICDLYFNKSKINFKSIMLCSQMHGFALISQENKPLSNYISWKDERSLECVKGKDTFSIINNKLGKRFKDITGMIPRPGLPFMNLMHLARLSELKGGCKVISLPEWFSLCCADSNSIVHDTILAGTGFYDVGKKQISAELRKIAKGITHINLGFNDLAPSGAISGYWHSSRGKIPIYVGVGDHQCSVLGARNLPKKTISINIGTGSQVSVIDKDLARERVELRPYFDSGMLTTITHIPAGRVFSEYLKFLEDVCKEAGNKRVDFWKKLKNLNGGDILNSTLEFDLGLFRSSWNYKNGGAVTNIYEGEFLLNNYLSGLVKSFIKQYLDAINVIDPSGKIDTYILSGGLSRFLPKLAAIFSDITKKEVVKPAKIDETLIGLRSLALISKKYAAGYLEAQEFYD